MVIVPLINTLPFYTQQAQLDGAIYGLEFLWNFREEAWYFTIYDSQGDAIAAGLRVVVGFPIGTRCRDARMPPGIFQFQDTTGGDADPGFADLGARVQLYYFTAGELL